MKLLYYNHTGLVSGAERMLLLTLSELDRTRFNSTLACPNEGELQRMAADLGVEHRDVPSFNARFTLRPDRVAGYLVSLWKTMRSLRQTVRDIQPDVLHANSTRAGIAASIATFGIPVRVIWHLHDVLPRHPISSAIRLLAFLSPSTEAAACSQSAAKGFLGRHLPVLQRPRMTVLLNAVQLDSFATEPDARTDIRSELRISEDDFLIGAVSQITRRKAHPHLLRAFAQVLQKVPSARLLVVGAPIFNKDHEYFEQLQVLARSLHIEDRVHFIGHRNDVFRVIQALDLFVLSSLVEPLGLVILEAMMAGVPVLATDSGGPGEIIRHGWNGWLVPPADDKALADGMVHLAQHDGLRREMGTRGPAHVKENWSSARYIRDVERLYDDSPKHNPVNAVYTPQTRNETW